MFEFTTWHVSFLDFLISLRHQTAIGNQLFISNDRNRVRWVVLGLLQDGACTDFFENLSENTLKGDLSKTETFNPPLFSLVDTFKCCITVVTLTGSCFHKEHFTVCTANNARQQNINCKHILAAAEKDRGDRSHWLPGIELHIFLFLQRINKISYCVEYQKVSQQPGH